MSHNFETLLSSFSASSCDEHLLGLVVLLSSRFIKCTIIFSLHNYSLVISLKDVLLLFDSSYLRDRHRGFSRILLWSLRDIVCT